MISDLRKPAAKMMLDEFKIVDANGDGGVTASEIGDYLQTR